MAKIRQTTVIFGHYLMASGLLGGSLAPIIVFNLEIESHPSLTVIVGYISSSTQILGSITIVLTVLAICKNKTSWIYITRTSSVSRVKVIALWILGIMLCVFYQTESYEYHSTRIFSELARKSTLVFVILQTLFITCCSRFNFYETRKIKYILSFLAVVNTVNWLDAIVLSSIFLTDCDSTYSGRNNDSLIAKPTVENRQIIYLFSFIMEFSIQATTFVITISMTKHREDNRVYIHCGNLKDRSCRPVRVPLSRKQRVFVAMISFVLNIPFVFYIIVIPASLNDFVNHVWLICVVGAKIVVFILIIIAYYDLYKDVSIRTERVSLNFNDVALILGTFAVAASGIINFLLRIDSEQVIIHFHTWFNIIYSGYQTIFVLFFKVIIIRDQDWPKLMRVRMIVIILVTYNLFYWVKDSLFFLPFIKSEVKGGFFRTLFFLSYPLVSFYRFQSAMGMIPFLF